MNTTLCKNNKSLEKKVKAAKKLFISGIILGAFLLIPLAMGFARPPLLLSTFAGAPLSTKAHSGMYDLILKEAFRRIGRKIEIIQLPAERSITNANRGITDGDFVRIYGLDKIYPNLIRIPEKITDFEFVAFSKNANIRIAGWKSLRPYNIGIVRGWKILEKNIIKTQSLIKAKNQVLLFNLLASDRIDIAVYSRFEGIALVHKLEMKSIKALKPALAVREMFLYLNKKHTKIVPRLTSSIRKMKKDGAFRKIKRKTLAAYYGK